VKNPHEPEPERFISMGEMMLREQSQRIRWEIERLHDRVIRLRDRLPP
jgi:hypothetical protein